MIDKKHARTYLLTHRIHACTHFGWLAKGDIYIYTYICIYIYLYTPPGLLGTGDNLAGERVQKTHGSLCQMQQGGLADVTEHVHGSFHLPKRPGRSSDENA